MEKQSAQISDTVALCISDFYFFSPRTVRGGICLRRHNYRREIAVCRLIAAIRQIQGWVACTVCQVHCAFIFLILTCHGQRLRHLWIASDFWRKGEAEDLFSQPWVNPKETLSTIPDIVSKAENFMQNSCACRGLFTKDFPDIYSWWNLSLLWCCARREELIAALWLGWCLSTA